MIFDQKKGMVFAMRQAYQGSWPLGNPDIAIFFYKHTCSRLAISRPDCLFATEINTPGLSDLFDPFI